MAKAVVPADKFAAKFGPLEPGIVHGKLREMATIFLRDTPADREREKRREVDLLRERGERVEKAVEKVEKPEKVKG
jgi:hypothetical protein